jgi:hypothetical protein
MTRRGMVCECLRCRKRRVDGLVERLADQSLSTALRHAQDPWEDVADEAGRASTTTLPPITRELRWSAPASIVDVANGRVPEFNEPNKQIKKRNKLRLYRITHGRKNLYFGIVHGVNKSVSDRIKEHWMAPAGTAKQRERSEAKQLAKWLKDNKSNLQATLVRYADIDAPTPYRHDPKYVHAIELLAQSALRPQIYVRGSLTFEDEDDADWS